LAGQADERVNGLGGWLGGQTFKKGALARAEGRGHTRAQSRRLRGAHGALCRGVLSGQRITKPPTQHLWPGTGQQQQVQPRPLTSAGQSDPRGRRVLPPLHFPSLPVCQRLCPRTLTWGRRLGTPPAGATPAPPPCRRPGCAPAAGRRRARTCPGRTPPPAGQTDGEGSNS